MVVQPNWDAILAIIIPNLVGVACIVPVSGQISNKDGTAWYQKLKKPSWILTEWLYGPIFVSMYSGMGYASYLVYSESSGFKDQNDIYPTAVYGAHLILTLIIAFTFYRFHHIGLGFALTFVLDGLLLALSVIFYQINQYSVIFLLPIQGWQIYGTLVMHAFWVLNKKDEDYRNLKV